MQMHKAFAGGDLVLQVQSEFWVSGWYLGFRMIFRSRIILLLIIYQTLNSFSSKWHFQSLLRNIFS